MNVQAEISLYPLRTGELGQSIDSFLGDLEAAGLTVREGSMSSTVAGDVDVVFSAVGAAFRTIAAGSQAVLVMKVSNACPSGDAVEGKDADAG